jgi:uncharacterized protein (TIGR03790 family)
MPEGMRRKQFLLVGFWAAWIFSLLLCGNASALSPDDLLVVYNSNTPDSLETAKYYAKKRGVPAENLVGVAVEPFEEITHDEYERELAPAVREAVQKMQAQGKKPAVLLIYGMPLRVASGGLPLKYRDFIGLSEAKQEELKHLILELLLQIDQLAAPPNRPITRTKYIKKNHSTPDLLKMAEESLQAGQNILARNSLSVLDRVQMATLMARLTGTRPLEAASASNKNSKAKPPQWFELLAMGRDMEIFQGVLPENARSRAALIRLTGGLVEELRFWENATKIYRRPDSVASVDSELSMVLAKDYQKAMWLPNPFLPQFDNNRLIDNVRATRLMVCRLDGPDSQTVRRIIDDGLYAEENGLRGKFYIDARGLGLTGRYGSYSWYERHLINLHKILTENTTMEVVLNKGPELFPPNECKDAALYCGWYSLGRYIPCFEWQRGAVGFHVASSEATTLRVRGRPLWCKSMLEEGAAGTLGPVGEPYLSSFPLPDRFFPLLLEGKLTLLEVYYRTIPQVSWKQTLIGDPLYRPFKSRPVLDMKSIRTDIDN